MKTNPPINPYVKISGGEGSGNFGHAGRTGKVGGSSAKGYIDAVARSEGVMWNPLARGTLAFIDEAQDIVKGQVQLRDDSDWYPDQPHVYFNIHVDQKHRGKGYGTEIMKRLTALADEHSIVLYGEPSPFGQGKKMSVKRLTAWYESLGFTVGDKPGIYGKVFYYPRTGTRRNSLKIAKVDQKRN